MAVPGIRATCAICFREFLTDERGRLFRHVRRLGEAERCPGFKFPPAGESLAGTQWALDRAAAQLLALDSRRDQLARMDPCNPVYTEIWQQVDMALEYERGKLVAEVDELQARLAEWGPTAPNLGPTPMHRVALWKCRAGTAVPLCHSQAERRPAGDPILLPTMQGVDCPLCQAVTEKFPSVMEKTLPAMVESSSLGVMKNNAWNVDDLTPDQRELIGAYLCQTNSGSYSFDDLHSKDILERMIPAAESLVAVGLVTIDLEDEECVVSLTAEGEAWLLTLPEGSLA